MALGRKRILQDKEEKGLEMLMLAKYLHSEVNTL